VKFGRFSEQLRLQALALKEDGVPRREIARRLKLGVSTSIDCSRPPRPAPGRSYYSWSSRGLVIQDACASPNDHRIQVMCVVSTVRGPQRIQSACSLPLMHWTVRSAGSRRVVCVRWLG